MKTTKKLAASIAALALALSMSTVAFAEVATDPSQATVSISTENQNSYVAYQIFTGTFDSDGNMMNDGLAFGTGVNGSALYSALVSGGTATDAHEQAVAALKALKGKSAKDVVALMKTAGVKNGTGTQLSNNSKLDYGYYYIEETIQGDANTKGDILKVAKGETLEITTKVGKPVIEKKVMEDDREVTPGGNVGLYPDTEEWNDCADYSIGESVPFKISVKMPDDIAEYGKYYLGVIDVLQASFSKPTEYKYYVVNGSTRTEITAPTVTTEDVTLDGVSNYNTKFIWDDLKAAIPQGTALTADSVIEIDYSATVKDTVVVGNKGNTNGVHMD